MASLSQSLSDYEYHLVKLPQFLAKNWGKQIQKHQSSNNELPLHLGNLSDFKNKKVLNIVSDESTQNLPSSYTMNFRESFNPMLVFSASEHSKNTRFESKLHSFSDIRVMDDDISYNSLLKERLINSTTKSRQISVITPEEIEKYNREHQTSASSSSYSKKKKQPKVKMDENVLEKMVLSLFEKHPILTRAELIHRTQQPANHLKKVLSKVCDEKAKGKFSLKTLYQLVENEKKADMDEEDYDIY